MRLVVGLLGVIPLVLAPSSAPALDLYFGDSLTGCPKHACYAAYLSKEQRRPYRLLAGGGYQISDVWEYIREVKPAADDRLFYLLGTNDVVRHTPNPLWASLSQAAFGASIYRLGSRVEQGDDLTFTGDLLILGYQIGDALTSTFTVAVDDAPVATLTQKPPTLIKTWHGKPPFDSVTPTFLRMRGFGPGTHRVTIRSDCETCPSPIEWIWQGPSGNPLYVMTTPRFSSVAYTRIGASDAAINGFAEFQRMFVAMARRDGLNVVLVDTNRIIDPRFHLVDDGVHFNEQGHRKVAEALIASGASGPVVAEAPPSPPCERAGWVSDWLTRLFSAHAACR